MSDFELIAEPRTDLGKGASRRLRREGKVPVVLYGGGKDPVALTMEHNTLAHELENEAFFSHILTVKVGNDSDQAIVKDLQRHPSRPIIMHMDLQRISANEKIRVHVPLHFMNEDKAPGVKAGGLITHNMVEVEVSCLPKDLPEYIEVELGAMELDDSIHLTDIKLPAGVELVELLHGADHDLPVVSIHLPRGAKEEAEEEGGEEEAPGEEG